MKKIKVVAISYYRYDADYIDDYRKNLKGLVDDFVLIKDDGDYYKVGEGKMMQRLKKIAVEKGADWILVLDVDERLEKNAPRILRKLINEHNGQRVKFSFNFRELFEPKKYRIDGIWGSKRRTCLFPAFFDNTYSNAAIHAPRDPLNPEYKEIDTGLNIYHLKHTRGDLAEQRKRLYKRLDPKNQIQDYDYLTDIKNIRLQPIEEGREFYPEWREYKIDPEFFNLKNFNNKNTFEKRALITAWSLNEMSGAGLNCLELAEELRNQGVEVDFFTYQKMIGPLSWQIEKHGYKIYRDRINPLKSEDEQNYSPIKMEDYDYLFLVENIAPISMLRQLGSGIVLPKIITLYMSELVGYPTDTPLTRVLNEKVADLNLTISNKAKRDIMYRVLDEDTPVDLYRNPAPIEFSKIKNRGGSLRRIAVVHSSGAGDEIVNMQEELKSKGIKVDYIGAQFDNVKKVNAEFYDAYDLVIGIGKNVQYSLVSGVPIYIYGRFGGPGYLSDELYRRIIDEGKADNFSGRDYGGFRTEKELVKDIIAGYPSALRFHEKNRKEFIEEYSIDKVVERIIKKVDKTKSRKANLSRKDVNWMVSVQILIYLHWRDRELNIINASRMKRDISNLEQQVKNQARTQSIKLSMCLLIDSLKRRVVRDLKAVTRKMRIRARIRDTLKKVFRREE